MVSSRGTSADKLDISKEHIKTLESLSRFCMVLTIVNEPDMQCDENRSDTGGNWQPTIWDEVHDGMNLS